MPTKDTVSPERGTIDTRTPFPRANAIPEIAVREELGFAWFQIFRRRRKVDALDRVWVLGEFIGESVT